MRTWVASVAFVFALMGLGLVLYSERSGEGTKDAALVVAPGAVELPKAKHAPVAAERCPGARRGEVEIVVRADGIVMVNGMPACRQALGRQLSHSVSRHGNGISVFVWADAHGTVPLLWPIVERLVQVLDACHAAGLTKLNLIDWVWGGGVVGNAQGRVAPRDRTRPRNSKSSSVTTPDGDWL